jgi:4-methylaminobutanoate oxidase (formaldehyde-forming)
VILEAGVDRGLVPAGMHALDSCRMEKKFLHFGHDIADEDTPVEAGMRFVCHFDKPIHFIGRAAVSAQLEGGGPLKKRMVQFLLQDPNAMLYHHEPILRNGATVGYLTSGNYGHTLGGSVGLGYVRCAIFSTRVTGKLTLPAHGSPSRQVCERSMMQKASAAGHSRMIRRSSNRRILS